MTTLTPAEKKAGRLFRADRQAALDQLNADQPTALASVFWRVTRHMCQAKNDVSIGITLREICEPCPEYRICYCSAAGPTVPGEFPHRDCDGSTVAVRAGQFAWIWKEGRCSGCGLSVRTKTGRFVIAADRPAEHERTPR